MKKYLFNYLLKKFQEFYVNGIVSDKEIENAVEYAIKSPSKIMAPKNYERFHELYHWLQIVMLWVFVPPCVVMIYMIVTDIIDIQKVIVASTVIVIAILTILIAYRETNKIETHFVDIKEYYEMRAVRHLQINNDNLKSLQNKKT